MIEVRRTEEFIRWAQDLRDEDAKAKIALRLRRLAMGNAGDVKTLGGGLSELRIDYGPGYRLYFTRRGKMVVILLCGGDKRTQTADIKRARKMLEGLE